MENIQITPARCKKDFEWARKRHEFRRIVPKSKRLNGGVGCRHSVARAITQPRGTFALLIRAASLFPDLLHERDIVLLSRAKKPNLSELVTSRQIAFLQQLGFVQAF